MFKYECLNVSKSQWDFDWTILVDTVFPKLGKLKSYYQKMGVAF